MNNDINESKPSEETTATTETHEISLQELINEIIKRLGNVEAMCGYLLERKQDKE